MTDDLVLVVDAGSSSLRAHLMNPDGRIRRSASRLWSYLDEPDASDLARAFDPDACWEAAQDVIGECLGGLHDGDQLSAVAITSQRQSLVLLDEQEQVLYAGPNTDLRAVFEGSALDFEHGELLYQTTGHRPAFMMAAGKLAWFRAHRPDAYARISHVLTLADWLAFKLTGELASEPTLASESGLLDISNRRWAGGMLREIGLEVPETPLAESSAQIGVVTDMDSGVSLGTPVVVAGADTQCGLVGLGISGVNRAGIVTGWSSTVQLLTDEARLSPEMKTWAGNFQNPDLWTLESSAGDMGNAYRWLADTVYREESDPYGRMDHDAEEVSVGSDGVTASLGPRTMDVSAVGMQLGGIVFPVPMTIGGPTRGQMVRATLESFAYALRANLEQAEAVAGRSAERVALGGGMTRTETFTRIMPEVLGRQIEVSSEPDATVVGAALVTRVAVGQFTSLVEAADHTQSDNLTLEPDTQNAAEYDDYYHMWLETQENLGQLLT